MEQLKNMRMDMDTPLLFDYGLVKNESEDLIEGIKANEFIKDTDPLGSPEENCSRNSFPCHDSGHIELTDPIYIKPEVVTDDDYSQTEDNADPLGSHEQVLNRNAPPFNTTRYINSCEPADPILIKPEVLDDQDKTTRLNEGGGVNELMMKSYFGSDLVEFATVHNGTNSVIKNEIFTKETIVKTSGEYLVPSEGAHAKAISPYACLKCGRCYESSNHLKWHVYYSHRNKYTCYHCGTSFLEKYTLNEHIKNKHLKEHKKEIQCPQCDRSFAKKRPLAQHMKYYHLNEYKEEIRCLECGRQYSNMGNLRRHMKINHSTNGPIERVYHTCSSCGRTYATKYGLTEHIKYCHLMDYKDEIMCTECGQCYYHIRSLNRHIREKHSPHGPIKYSCYHCKKNFMRKCTLTKHIIHSHLKSFKKGVECLVCGRRYQHTENLKKHWTRKHSLNGTDEYISYHGSKRFVNKFSLTKHINIHLSKCKEEIPCLHCGKHFAGQDSLIHHIRHYHKEGMKCLQCGLRCNNMRNLKRHWTHEHSPFGPVRYICFHCSKNFAKKYSLTKHIMNNHFRKCKKKAKCPKSVRLFVNKGFLSQHCKYNH